METRKIPARPAPSEESLGQRLRRLRLEHGHEQSQLADQLGVSKVTIWNWERDKARPRSHSLKLLAELYGCSVPALTQGESVERAQVAADAPLKEVLDVYKSEIAQVAGTRPDDVAITISFRS